MNAKCLWAAIVTFGMALAALIVERLDNQALAMLAGAACGVAAGVPVTAAIFWISQRQRAENVAAQREPREPVQPVIVVQSPAAPAPAPQLWPQSYAPLPPTRPPRDFNIIGDEGEEDGNP